MSVITHGSLFSNPLAPPNIPSRAFTHPFCPSFRPSSVFQAQVTSDSRRLRKHSLLTYLRIRNATEKVALFSAD